MRPGQNSMGMAKAMAAGLAAHAMQSEGIMVVSPTVHKQEFWNRSSVFMFVRNLKLHDVPYHIEEKSCGDIPGVMYVIVYQSDKKYF